MLPTISSGTLAQEEGFHWLSDCSLWKWRAVSVLYFLRPEWFSFHGTNQKLTYTPWSPSSPWFRTQSCTELNFDIFSSNFMSSKCHTTGEQNSRTEIFSSNPQQETISRQEKIHCRLSCSSPSWANRPADASLGMGPCFQASGTHTLQLLGQGNGSHHAHMWKSISDLSVSVCLPKCTGSLILWNHHDGYLPRPVTWLLDCCTGIQWWMRLPQDACSYHRPSHPTEAYRKDNGYF